MTSSPLSTRAPEAVLHRSILTIGVVAMACLASASSPARSDPLFAEPFSLQAGIAPWFVAAGDVNRDGRPDLVVANLGNFSGVGVSMSVILGYGSGVFAPHVDFPTLGGSSVEIGDLNGDGNPDLVQGGTTVLLGNGDGSFGAPLRIVGGGSYAALGDLNGDGRLDLVSISGAAYDPSFRVLFGNGDGTFGVPITLEAGPSPSFALIRDLNGDGKADMVVLSLSQVSVFLGNGDGTFQSRIAYSAGSFSRMVAAADLDGDGRLDLVTANGLGTTISVFLGNGDGTVSPKTDYEVGFDPFAVGIGDLNGDGKPDLASVNYSDRTLSVLLGNGDGTFGAHEDYATEAGGSSIAIADLNADGRLDVAVNGLQSSSVSVFLNVSTPPNSNPDCSAATASPALLWPPNHRLVGIRIVGVTDPDGDAVSTTVTGVTQDEPISGGGGRSKTPDARLGDGGAEVRAERSGAGNGRVYRIAFVAEDGRGGRCDGVVRVCVPHDGRPDGSCIEDGASYNSLGPVFAIGSGADAAESPGGAVLRLTRDAGSPILEYELPEDCEVTLAMYDLAGRRVAVLANERQTRGVHRATWNASGAPTGMYFFRLSAGRAVVSRAAWVKGR